MEPAVAVEKTHDTAALFTSRDPEAPAYPADVREIIHLTPHG